ncbi:hypothetical protein [Wolbachia endosymbiont of Oedothorax gibbosus]|nr:hypothetical protein [Wolbachia endosymbiont of Oedothorax gibbosus]
MANAETKIPVLPFLSSQSGMALLHSNRKNLAVTDKIHYKIAI